MRVNPNETMAEWAVRVQEFELGYAKRQIASGADINLVLEAMSVRIQQKLLHPIFKALQTTSNLDYDAKAAKAAYNENYAKRGPVADHVTED